MHLLPWYGKIQWILYNVALPNSILVTLVYWTFLYSGSPRINTVSGFLDLALHGLNSVFMIIEYLTALIPSRLLHVYQPMLYGVIYIIFSLILWFSGHITVYPGIVDWRTANTAGTIVGFIIFYALMQFLLYVIRWLMNSCCCKADHSNS